MKTSRKNRQKLTEKSKRAQQIYSLLNRLPFLTKSKRYCVTTSDKQKFVWYRVAKVGTRTIYNALKKANVEFSVEHAYNICAPTGHFEGYFKFAFVRNPFDRLVSCWLNKVVGRDKGTLVVDEGIWNEIQDFSGFISFVETLDLKTCNIHLREQSSLIDLSAIDFIGRMENFEADLAEVLGIIGVPVAELEKKNASKARKSYQEYYKDADIERVYKLYQKDCQIFGYQF